MSDTENEASMEGKAKIKNLIRPKVKKEKDDGEIKVNPKYNISEIGNKARRKELFAKLKKEKKKASLKCFNLPSIPKNNEYSSPVVIIYHRRVVCLLN